MSQSSGQLTVWVYRPPAVAKGNLQSLEVAVRHRKQLQNFLQLFFPSLAILWFYNMAWKIYSADQLLYCYITASDYHYIIMTSPCWMCSLR